MPKIYHINSIQIEYINQAKADIYDGDEKVSEITTDSLLKTERKADGFIRKDGRALRMIVEETTGKYLDDTVC